MLVIAQKWLEGQQRILLAVPNADLLFQWTKLIDEFYSVPYVVISSRSELPLCQAGRCTALVHLPA